MNHIQMNSMNSWSSYHHYRNASILKQLTDAYNTTNESTLVTNTISINEKTSDVSPRCDIKLNIQKMLSEEKPLLTERELTTSPYNFTNGRPCLAGTQTLKHHQITKNQETSLDLTNESVLSLKACDFTQDSSGIGSMISDHCNTSYFKDRDSSDSQLHWHNRSLITLDEDTNDMNLNKNSYIAGSCENNANNREAPVMKTEYQRLEAQVKRPELAMPTSPPSEGKSTIQCGSCDEFDYDTMVAQTRMIANRDFQTIDENLASVARYVEELTGCGESNKSDNISESQFTKTLPINRQTTSSKSIYPHQHSHHHLQQQQQQHTTQSTSSSSASSIRNQQDYQLLKLQQLQQLYQKLISLASMKSHKIDDKNSSESTIQDLLLRLLANQNINEPLLSNLLSNVDSILEKSTRRSLSTVGQNCKQFNISTNQLPRHNRRIGRSDLTSYDECLLRNILSNASNTSIPTYLDGISSTNVHGGQNINDNLTTTVHNNRRSNSLQNSLLSSNYNQLINLISQLDANDVTTNLLSQATSVNTNTVALLANLLNATQYQSTTSVVNSSSTTPQEQHNLLYSLLANQLASFQSDPLLNSNNTNISQLLHERETSLLNSTVLKSECQGDISSPSTSSSTQRHQHTISDGSLTEELSQLALPYQQLMSSFENDIDKAANVYRNSASTVAQTSEAAYHWSGKLPSRVHRSMTYSRKVFLGGVPWDSTSEELVRAFCRFGNVNVCWPQKEISSSINTYSKPSSTKGYCYLVFEHEASVSELLANCVHNPTTGGEYYKISSPKFISKDVQVIPWIISDSQYTKSTPNSSDIKRTVFVGALHALITAETLVTIMNDLFGNVVFAALDTDKYKYPIGSGRVIFSSHKSYMKAITANFVDIRTSKFIKTIQIDPYLEDAICNSCLSYPGMYFCRAFECFNYFCPACWHIWHNSTETLNTHKPLRRTFKPNSERQWQSSAASVAAVAKTTTVTPPSPPTTTLNRF
ncbi:Cytoplasmic polyadenylation element-binding protein isoform 1 [Schistosoma japonicum]|uniref:Cytoplasmic polyadenylation element-binding protein isoform 1 n=1 Tax=Schistosoma japonicum TaxID=6182 RepID=A0A4Z2D984_SCHJA|nr:Cytoplasmic polyadenylation element-binding protein [Schistosoma japonicum]TNN13067.1 Cytoplasmic polyadenylation element-binding protein isoform 1 [Schistosoma japonicum]